MAGSYRKASIAFSNSCEASLYAAYRALGLTDVSTNVNNAAITPKKGFKDFGNHAPFIAAFAAYTAHKTAETLPSERFNQ